MNRRLATIFTIAAALLSGCGSSKPLSPEEAAARIPAVISVDRSFGSPALHIVEIDEDSTRHAAVSYSLSGGPHELLIEEQIFNRRSSRIPMEPQTLSVNLAPGGRYILFGRIGKETGMTCLWLDDSATQKTIAFTPATCVGLPFVKTEPLQKNDASIPLPDKPKAPVPSPRRAYLPRYDRSCQTDADCVSVAELTPRCFQHCRESACEGAFIDTCQVYNRFSDFRSLQCSISAICRKPASISCVQKVCTAS